MALPIKETSILNTEESKEFHRKVRKNLKKDHSKEFKRAKKVFDRLSKQGWDLA
jgi:hypothetical protein